MKEKRTVNVYLSYVDKVERVGNNSEITIRCRRTKEYNENSFNLVLHLSDAELPYIAEKIAEAMQQHVDRMDNIKKEFQKNSDVI